MSFPREDIAIEIQTWKLRELLKWRDYLEILVEAVKTVFGEGAEVYVFGSAVEGKLTVDSDVDIAVVLVGPPRASREKSRLLSRLWKVMEEKGVPWWYPFEIHLLTKEELSLLEGAKLVRIL